MHTLFFLVNNVHVLPNKLWPLTAPSCNALFLLTLTLLLVKKRNWAGFLIFGLGTASPLSELPLSNALFCTHPPALSFSVALAFNFFFAKKGSFYPLVFIGFSMFLGGF